MSLHQITSSNILGCVCNTAYRYPYLFAIGADDHDDGLNLTTEAKLVAYTYVDGVLTQIGTIYLFGENQFSPSIVGIDDNYIYCTWLDERPSETSMFGVFSFNGSIFNKIASIATQDLIWYMQWYTPENTSKCLKFGQYIILITTNHIEIYNFNGINLTFETLYSVSNTVAITKKDENTFFLLCEDGIYTYSISGSSITLLGSYPFGYIRGNIIYYNNLLFIFGAWVGLYTLQWDGSGFTIISFFVKSNFPSGYIFTGCQIYENFFAVTQWSSYIIIVKYNFITNLFSITDQSNDINSLTEVSATDFICDFSSEINGNVGIPINFTNLSHKQGIASSPLSDVPGALEMYIFGDTSDLTYLWDFGDLNTSTDKDPSYAYNNPGTYTVTLTITSAWGSKTETKTNYITIIQSETGYLINQDDYFKKQQPAKYEELVNYIQITTQPLILSTEIKEVYRSRDEIVLTPATSDMIEILYSDAPVKNAEVTIIESDSINVQILNVDYYPWGAYVTVHNAGSTTAHFKLLSNGKPLTVSGQQVIVKKDDNSIRENGFKKYEYPNNHLIQSAVIAERIAENLLASYKIYRKDVLIEWRGNPALELGDEIRVPEYKKYGIDKHGHFKIFKNELIYNGTLRARTEGRKIL